jgi:hypothetical protein
LIGLLLIADLACCDISKVAKSQKEEPPVKKERIIGEIIDLMLKASAKMRACEVDDACIKSLEGEELLYCQRYLLFRKLIASLKSEEECWQMLSKAFGNLYGVGSNSEDTGGGDFASNGNSPLNTSLWRLIFAVDRLYSEGSIRDLLRFIPVEGDRELLLPILCKLCELRAVAK